MTFSLIRMLAPKKRRQKPACHPASASLLGSLRCWSVGYCLLDAHNYCKMASASYHPLNEHGREDRFEVPHLFPGEDYVFDADYIIVLKDKAQAATNAICEVFEAKVYEAMCVTHAAIRWFSVNASKFHDIRNKNLCINDINHAYKILGHVNFVEVGRRLLMEKWVNQYREPLVARDWLASWGMDHLTRVENCAEHLCPLRGGIPCDNNALEAGNVADKESLVYKKSNLFDFVDNVATKIIRPASMMDTMFEGRLKNRTQTRMNSAVYNINYFKDIVKTECLDVKGFPTYISLQFDYVDVGNDVPKGSFLVACAHCLVFFARLLPSHAWEKVRDCSVCRIQGINVACENSIYGFGGFHEFRTNYSSLSDH